MWSGGDAKVPPMSSALPASSGSAPANPPSEVKENEESEAMQLPPLPPPPKAWASMAGPCFQASAKQSEVKLTGGLNWGPSDAEVISHAFGLGSEYKDAPEKMETSRIHPGTNSTFLCLASGGPVSDRKLITDMEARCAAVLSERTGDSSDVAGKKCDALIEVLEYTAAPSATVETSYAITHHPAFWPISIIGGVTAGGFGFGLGMHLFDLSLKERITRIFRKNKGPDDKDPPAPAGGTPGAAPSSSSVFTGAAHFAASYALMKASEAKHFVTDTTAGKVALGTAIGIGILATAPVSIPMIIGGGTLYGGSAAMFSLVDMNVIQNGGLGPNEA
jgi:hypothetical protein